MPPGSQRQVPQAAAVAAVATTLTVYMAWPVLTAPWERLFGSELVGRFHDPFTVIRIFQTPRASFGIYTQPLTDWLGALLAMAFDAVIAYNAMVLLSYPLAALAAFGLGRFLGCGPRGATLGALAFAFAPAHLAHSAYHPHIAQVHWIPLYLWALWNACRRPKLWTWSLAGAALVAMGLANFYFGWFGAVLLPVAALAAPQPWARRRRTAAALAVAAGVFVVLAMTPAAAAFRESHGFSLDDAQRYAARPEAYLVPAADHLVLGAPARDHWSRRAPGDAMLEQQQSLSWALLALFLFAISARRRDRDDPELAYVPVLAATGIAAVVLSLAPQASLGSTTVWLPSMALHLAAPMFRAMARFGFFVQLVVCLGAAIGFERMRRRRGPARIAAYALVAVVAFEYLPAPPWRWRPVLPTEAHRLLAASAEGGAVLDCVTPPHAAASVAAHVPWRLLSRHPDRLDCEEPALAGKLAAMGIQYVIGDADASEIEGLTLLDRHADSSTWRVVAPPAPIYVSRMSGFSWREAHEGRSYRWMGPEGALTVVAREAVPQSLIWRAELHAFPHVRNLSVRLDGEEVARLRVPPEPAWLEIGPLRLRPGTHTLELLPREPAAVPDALHGTGDTRPLTVALGAWSWEAGRSAASPPSE